MRHPCEDKENHKFPHQVINYLLMDFGFINKNFEGLFVAPCPEAPQVDTPIRCRDGKAGRATVKAIRQRHARAESRLKLRIERSTAQEQSGLSAAQRWQSSIVSVSPRTPTTFPVRVIAFPACFCSSPPESLKIQHICFTFPLQGQSVSGSIQGQGN